MARLRESEAALKARGVAHAALFGSRARGDARPDSDTDIMIEIDTATRMGVYDYVGLKEFIASLFDGPVDVVNRDGLKPYVKPAATADAIYAFWSRSDTSLASMTCGQHMGRPFKTTPRQRREGGELLTEIARSYNVSPATISMLPP